MDFPKMSFIFTYCSTLQSNIPLKDDYMIRVSRLCMIVGRQIRFMILIQVSDNLTTENCTDSFTTHVTSVINYPY